MIIGHRGAKGHVAENTMASIDQALEFGVDGIEIDVFLIKSGEVVVFHDEDLDRLTDTHGKIEAMTMDELRKVLVMGKHPIPTLEEVLQRIDGRVVLNIELKGNGTAKPVHSILERYIGKTGWEQKDLLISSFKWHELEVYRSLDPEIAIGVLTEHDVYPAIIKAKEIHARAINANHHLLTPQTVADIKAANLQVWCWTVNRLPDLERMVELNVDAIITDYPDRLMD